MPPTLFVSTTPHWGRADTILSMAGRFKVSKYKNAISHVYKKEVSSVENTQTKSGGRLSRALGEHWGERVMQSLRLRLALVGWLLCPCSNGSTTWMWDRIWSLTALTSNPAVGTSPSSTIPPVRATNLHFRLNITRRMKSYLRTAWNYPSNQ